MPVPDSVTICGYPYRVSVEDHGDENGKINGTIKYADGLILVADSQTEMHKRAVMVHEIIHGIACHTGHNDLRMNEDYTEALSYSLLTVLRDNPALVTYLTEPID